MRIVVDFGLCKGHGVCMEEAPTVFQVSRDGTLTLLIAEPPPELRSKVEAAVKYCPTEALSLHDE
jgi:sterol 14-demethylase